MGLPSILFGAAAPPLRIDDPYDGLPPLPDIDPLHDDALLSAGPVVLKRRHLRRIGPRQLRQGVRCRVLLRDVFDILQAPRKSHRKIMGRDHLGYQSDVQPSRRLTSGQHPGDDVSRVKQDGFVLLRRDLDEA